jgi:hypothetical protein
MPRPRDTGRSRGERHRDAEIVGAVRAAPVALIERRDVVHRDRIIELFAVIFTATKSATRCRYARSLVIGFGLLRPGPQVPSGRRRPATRAETRQFPGVFGSPFLGWTGLRHRF